jgi:hypothetical protein
MIEVDELHISLPVLLRNKDRLLATQPGESIRLPSMLGRRRLSLRRISEARDGSTTPGLSFWSWDVRISEK